MYRFCSEYGIAHDNCGKIVVATKQEELPALENLLRRGTENGLTGIRQLAEEELKEVRDLLEEFESDEEGLLEEVARIQKHYG